MKRVFLIHHMKRSGGHAVINWLQEGEKESVFINNDIPIQPILLGKSSLPDGSVSLDDWLARKPPEAVRAIERTSTLFVSLEDHGLEVRPFQHPHVTMIIILREPENLFASRIRKASTSSLKAYDYRDPRILSRSVRLWKEHARVVLGLTQAPSRHVALLYDAWLTSDHYRESVARELGVSAPQRPSGKMTSEGGGSSFAEQTVDLLSLRRRADMLDETEREVLRRIMVDTEMRDLAAKTAAAMQKLGSVCRRA